MNSYRQFVARYGMVAIERELRAGHGRYLREWLVRIVWRLTP